MKILVGLITILSCIAHADSPKAQLLSSQNMYRALTYLVSRDGTNAAQGISALKVRIDGEAEVDCHTEKVDVEVVKVDSMKPFPRANRAQNTFVIETTQSAHSKKTQNECQGFKKLPYTQMQTVYSDGPAATFLIPAGVRIQIEDVQEAPKGVELAQ